MRVEDWSSNKVQMYGFIGGAVKNLQVNLPASYDPLYLKLEKTGTSLSGYWSSDGTTWNLIQTYTGFSAAST